MLTIFLLIGLSRRNMKYELFNDFDSKNLSILV